MEGLTTFHILGSILTLSLIIFIGIYSGRKVKDAKDFSGGGRSAGWTLVSGTIIGTLVGGSSTIGTAQLAFTNGLSAWWFTIGAGIGCLLLGTVFTKALRKSSCETIQEIITVEYGRTSGVITSVLASFGIMLNIVAQILAANSLLSSMFGLSPEVSAIISVVLMACYVIFGGVLSTGILGVIKLLLIYISVIFSAIIAFKLAGGINEIYNSLPHDKYFNFFSRGIGVDGGAFMSVVLGVLSTQTYVQAVLSGKSDKESIKGALISSLLIPPIGIGGILVGYYMRINYPTIASGQAFPLFIINYMPSFIGGGILATLLIALLGTGSGMALGFATIITKDIYKKYINKNASSREELLVTRIVILLSLLVSAMFTLGNLKSAVLKWGFMSMGLRAAVLLIPMISALFFKGKISSTFAVLSSVLGFGAFLVNEIFLNLNIDSLIIGVIVSALTGVMGGIVKHKHTSQ
ncbi:MAG TPA: sodium:solute symporter family protein [Tissierellia bacterium]|nr:sodium:solute symporter family protein [Tissierellia bacterium]